MNDTAIDFAKLRKIEKLHAKQERLLRRRQHLVAQEQPQQINNDGNSNTIGNDNNSSRIKATQKIINPMEFVCTYTSCSKFIQDYKVQSKLNSVYYVPQCLNNEFTEILLEWLKSLPVISQNQGSYETNGKNDEKMFNGKWTRLKHAQRNVALFDLRSIDKDNDLRCDISPLQTLCHLLVKMKVFPTTHPPNHVLINEYQPMEGIMPHTDGPLYFHKTATFSIGGDVLFQFTKRAMSNNSDKDNYDAENSVMQIMLSGKGSLIVFDGDAYINHCHSINDRISRVSDDSIHDVVEYASCDCINLQSGAAVQRGHRFSLTFRHKLS